MGLREGLVGAILGLILMPTASEATVNFTFEGISNKGVNVRVTADLTLSGNDLSIVLTNDSQNHSGGGATTANPDDLLTSFYFDIFDGNSRPTLSYDSATGDLFNVLFLAADTDEADIDLRAFNVGDFTWQYKDTFSTGCPGPTCWADPIQFGADPLHMGIGTVGNNSLTPNGFNGNIVDAIDYGIYTGADIETASLNGSGVLLIKNSATFNFTGVSGFTEADIANEAIFGFGTQPDSTGFVPEPGTGLLLGFGLMTIGLRQKKRSR